MCGSGWGEEGGVGVGVWAVGEVVRCGVVEGGGWVRWEFVGAQTGSMRGLGRA